MPTPPASPTMRATLRGLRPARVILATGALVLCSALASCATPSALAPGTEPTSPSVDAGLLTTTLPVTVLDRGTGAELCLGGVAESRPPQCGGPVLVGWDWTDWDRLYEDVSGVRWGEFIVTGTYDPDAGQFTPTEVQPGEGYEYPDATEPDFSSPCPEPAGGWRVIDETMTTLDTMNATVALAAELDGYATLWMDQSPNPVTDPYNEVAMNDPMLTIVNVAVTGDIDAAESQLRRVWGGMLCVSQAQRTEAERLAIVNEVMSETEGILVAGPGGIENVVEVLVIFDDGTLQRSLDDRYGVGVVRVSSALTPVA